MDVVDEVTETAQQTAILQATDPASDDAH